jgi:hypothetical protein
MRRGKDAVCDDETRIRLDRAGMALAALGWKLESHPARRSFLVLGGRATAAGDLQHEVAVAEASPAPRTTDKDFADKTSPEPSRRTHTSDRCSTGAHSSLYVIESSSSTGMLKRRGPRQSNKVVSGSLL